MGQKTNPTIFRLNNWNLQCVEKNKEEHNLFTYQNIEIQKYLVQFFSDKGLNIHNIKLLYSQKSLYIYITYHSTKELYSFVKKNLKFKSTKIHTSQNKTIFNEKISNYFTTKKYKVQTALKIKRLEILSKFKNYIINQNQTNSDLVNKNYFLQQVLETLTKFTGNYYDIKIVLQNFNQGLIFNLDENQKNIVKHIR
jgi:hypothetical protein